jgi:anti-sigma B factor antagonist
MPFSVAGSSLDGVVTLRVSGDLDLATAPELQQAGEGALGDPSCRTLRLNISDVGFIDSTGLGVLIGLRNNAESATKRLIVDNPSVAVSRLLELSGLSTVFEIQPAG